MPLEPLRIVAILLHFGGFALIALSFVHIAIVVRIVSTKLLKECKCFPGTMLPMYPNLIVLGAMGFFFTTFSYAYATILADFDIGIQIRFFAIAVSLLADLIILHAIHGYSVEAKHLFAKGVAG